MIKKLAEYQNGNATVTLYDNGTKVRETKDDHWEVEFPESIDLKITNKCKHNCPYCHEKSTSNGEHGDILNIPVLKTLKKGTELAIGGGNPLEHPEIIDFLIDMMEQGVVCNLTIHQDDLNYHVYALQCFNLLHGVGISYTKTKCEKWWKKYNILNNTVLHIIAGVLDLDSLKNLYDKDLTILILGYKNFGRGETYSEKEAVYKNIKELKKELPKMRKHFRNISFDNLAIKQLGVREMIGEEEWEKSYMGDDGQFTMYIDAVKQEFAVSSISTERHSLEGYSDIKEVFAEVKSQWQ